MNIAIELGPGSSVAKVNLAKGEELTTEGGCMVAMNKGLSVETTTHKKGKGSVMKSLKRLISGESFFMNHYTANEDNQEIYLSATLPGDMFVYELKGDSLSFKQDLM